MFNSAQSLGLKAKGNLPHVLLNIGQNGSGEDDTSSVNKTPN